MARSSKQKSDSKKSDSNLLVNKLTVEDAVHLVKNEGGPLTTGRIVFRATTVLIVAIITARAIVLGQATVWHLFLPMVGEYLVLLLSLPVIVPFLNDPELKKDARKCLVWLFGIGLIVSLWIVWRAFDEGNAFTAQARVDSLDLFEWITGHEMHWPILGAVIAMVIGMPGRIAAFHRHGPPFVPVGLGCAMRLIIPLLGCFLLPFVASGAFPLVWVIWTILFFAEIGALYMHWDLQKRLAKRGIDLGESSQRGSLP